MSYLVVDIDGDFKIQLEDLAPLLLEPSKLVVKTINGNSVTGKDLLEYFKVCYRRVHQPNSLIVANHYGGIKSTSYEITDKYFASKHEM